MAKVQAVYTIQRAKTPGQRAKNGEPAVAPETETIKPGTIFEASGDELKELEKMGAVKKPDEMGVSRELVEGGDDDDGDDSPEARRARTASSTKAKPATLGAAAKAKEEGKPDGTEIENEGMPGEGARAEGEPAGGDEEGDGTAKGRGRRAKPDPLVG